MVKHLPAMQETQVRSLGWKDLLEKGLATHSSTLAWKIPWTEETGRLQSMGLQRVGQNWATSLSHYKNVVATDFFPLNIFSFPYFLWSLNSSFYAALLCVVWLSLITLSLHDGRVTHPGQGALFKSLVQVEWCDLSQKTRDFLRMFLPRIVRKKAIFLPSGIASSKADVSLAHRGSGKSLSENRANTEGNRAEQRRWSQEYDNLWTCGLSQAWRQCCRFSSCLSQLNKFLCLK